MKKPNPKLPTELCNYDFVRNRSKVNKIRDMR